jgi:hypothetical protein
MTRRHALWALLALVGIVLTAAITWATSTLTSQRIGLETEPLSAGAKLAPAVTAGGAGQGTHAATSRPTGATRRSATRGRSRTHGTAGRGSGSTERVTSSTAGSTSGTSAGAPGTAGSTGTQAGSEGAGTQVGGEGAVTQGSEGGSALGPGQGQAATQRDDSSVRARGHGRDD